ncbi:glycosyltransferase [Xylanibacillus composti]|nr:glycosyltransferase [Xylanibacillus composti]
MPRRWGSVVKAKKLIHNANRPKVSVIIPVMNERKTIRRVMARAAKIHPQVEIIVVANGSTDGTARIARAAGARVLVYPKPLGHDVGRSIGAKAAKGDILLFLDGDIPIASADLIPFIKAVEDGVDVALNRYAGPVHRTQVHSVILAKHALNIAMGRSDLRGVSMTTVPHALSRSALRTIGADILSVPPCAQVRAVANGLKVEAVHHVNVGSTNPRKRKRVNGKDPLEFLILGDHAEAIHKLLTMKGPRANRIDKIRRREWLV